MVLLSEGATRVEARGVARTIWLRKALDRHTDTAWRRRPSYTGAPVQIPLQQGKHRGSTCHGLNLVGVQAAIMGGKKDKRVRAMLTVGC